MFKRIGFLVLLAATLTACGGGSGEGLSYTSPQVLVKGLEAGQSVSVTLGDEVETLLFVSDGQKSFSRKIASGRSYALALEAQGTSCSFSDGQPAINSLKTESSPHEVLCGAEMPVTPVDPEDPEDSVARTLNLTMTNGTADAPVSAAAPATVQVVLRSPDGSLLGQELIEFSSTLGNLTAESALTNDSGVAQVTLQAGSVKGAGTLTATHSYKEENGGDRIVTMALNFATDGDQVPDSEPVSPDYSLEVTLVGGNTVTPTQNVTVQAKITTSGTGSVQGIPVRFSSEFGVLSQASALTDASGVASVTLSNGDVGGAGWLEARADLGSSTLSARVAVQAEGASSGQPITSAPIVITSVLSRGQDPAAPIDESNPGVLTVTLMRDGSPVEREVVAFAATLGQVNPGTALTNAAGVATVNLVAGEESGAGSVMITVETQDGLYSDVVKYSMRGVNEEEAGASNYSLTIVSISNALGPIDATNPITEQNPANVVVRLSHPDAATNPVAAQVVSFSTSGLGELGQLSGLTDVDGKVQVQLSAGAAKGAGSLTATYEPRGFSSVEASSNFATNGTGTGAVQGELSVVLQLLDGASVVLPEDARVNASRPLTASATVMLDGVAQPGVVVRFSSEVGSLSQSAVLTDATGVAAVTLSDGDVAGAGVLTVSVVIDQDSATAVMNVEAAGDGEPVVVPDPIIITTNLSRGLDPALPIDENNQGVLTVTLTKGGAPVVGEVVAFAATLGQVSPGTALTDGAGVAVVNLVAGADSGAGTVTITVEPQSGEIYSSKVNYSMQGAEQQAGASDYSLAIVSITNTGGAVDATNPIVDQSPATVLVRLSHPDAATHPVAGQVVTFTTSGLGELGQVSGLTNAAGEVQVQLSAGAAKGAGTLTATYVPQGFPAVTASRNFATNGAGTGGVQGELNIVLELLDGAAVVAPADARVNATRSLTARATVTLDGVAQPGVVVRFSSEVGSLSQSAVLTDATGVAAVTLSDGDVAGAGVLTVSVVIDQDSATAVMNVEAAGDGEPVVVPDPIIITTNLSRGLDPALPIDENNQGVLTVTLTKGGAPVVGEVVAFAATLGQVSPGTALTDGAGVATVNLVAGADSGAGTVTITVTSRSGDVHTEVVKYAMEGVQAAPEYTVTALLTSAVGSAGQPPVSNGNPGTLQVTVRRDGLVVAGEVVTFSPSLGSLSQNSALTNVSGVVTVQVLAGTETGAGTITIEVAGQTATVNVAYQGDVPVDDGYRLEIVSITITNTGDAVDATNPIVDQSPATVLVRLSHPDDIEGSLVRNKLIEVATTLGVLDGVGVNEGSASASLLTDADGEVEFELRPSGVSGGGLITAALVGSDVDAEPKAFVIDLAQAGVFLEPLRLLDAGVDARIIPTDGWLDVQAKVTDAGGNSVPNKVVVFTLTGPDGVGALDPVSASALTDSFGLATIRLLPGSVAGAAILTANVRIGWEGDEQSSSQSIAFQSPGEGFEASPEVVDLELTLERDGVVISQVNEGQAVLLKVALTSSGSPWLGEAYIEFDSRCMAAGQATINGVQDVSPVAVWSGEAQAVYVPSVGCTNDVIAARAAIAGNDLLDTQDLEIVAADGSSIEFLSALPNVLGLKGSAQAGAEETSVLTFVVKNTNGQPVAAGTRVTFETNGSAGGFEITSDTIAPTSSDGRVSVTVRSGSVPGVAGVKASLVSDPAVFTTGHISIHSGVVTQDRFVLAVSDINIAAWDHLGTTVTVTARLADRFGNWVPDGTRVNFAAELGDIEGSCQTESGACSVTWTSQGPQPFNLDHHHLLPGRASRDCEGGALENYKQGTIGRVCGSADRSGRSTITAWTVGEESFADANGNNLFDVDEIHVGLPEAFVDFNETGKRDRDDDTGYVEQFIDYNSNGHYDGVSGNFQGVGCSSAANALGHCQSLVHVRRSALIVLSTDKVVGSVLPGTVTAAAGGDIEATISDDHDNAPAIGSSITVVPGEGAKMLGPASCTVPAATEPLKCKFRVVPSGTDPLTEDVQVIFQSAAEVPPEIIYIPISP